MSFGGDMVSPKWRGTNDYPTMSFAVGFLCSCLGISFRRDISEVKSLRDALKVHIVVINKGRRLMDFQTAGAGTNLKDDLEKMSRVIKPGGGGSSDIYTKELLADGKFDIILEVADEALCNKLVEAIKSPVWLPFLGRKSNHLSNIPFGGVYGTLDEALAGYPKGVLFIQHVTPSTEGSEPTKDYPLCEGDNRTTTRYIKESFI